MAVAATGLEANVAVGSIVWHDTGGEWRAYMFTKASSGKQVLAIRTTKNYDVSIAVHGAANKLWASINSVHLEEFCKSISVLQAGNAQWLLRFSASEYLVDILCRRQPTRSWRELMAHQIRIVCKQIVYSE